MEKTPKTKLAKITRLYGNIADFFQRAIFFSENGRHVDGLDVLFTARRFVKPYSSEDLELLIQIAEFYSEMGLFNESNKMLFECMGHSPFIDDIFFGLINNFVALNQPEKVDFYISLGRNYDVFEQEYSQALEALEGLNSKSNLRLVKDNNRSHMILMAKQFMESPATYDFSHQILTSLLDDKDSFIDVCNGLSLLSMKQGNLEKALEYCDNVLEKQPNNFDALTQKSVAFSILGQREEALQIIDSLEEIDALSISDGFKLITCAVSVDCDKRVEQFTKKLLNRLPYDKELLTLYSIACCNLGEYDRAEETALKRYRVFQDDFEGKYFVKTIRNSIKTKERIPLTAFVDSKTEEEMFSALFDALKDESANKLINKIKSDEMIADALEWSASKNTCICVMAMRVLAKSQNGFSYVNRVLTNPKFPIQTKKQVFHYACMHQKFEYVSMVLNDIMLQFKPSIPKISSNKDFINAYFKAYSSLAFVTTAFDKKLNTAYKKIVKAFSDVSESDSLKDMNENVLAAVLAHKSNQTTVFSKPSYCCEVFRCTEEDFVLYCKYYENYFNQKKAEAKKKD